MHHLRRVRLALQFLFAMSALFAAIASSAFAAHEWLDLNSNPPALNGSATLFDGSWLLHHKPPLLLGGGSILISCTGEFHGLVFSAGKDEITDVLGLSGELNLIHCEVLSSTSNVCPAGTLITWHEIGLPWKTELVLEGTASYDRIFESSLGKKPGYEFECESLKTFCSENDRYKFVGNAITGAEFQLLGELTDSCTDGGTSILLGGGTDLDWFVH